jgi:GYF domain 2
MERKYYYSDGKEQFGPFSYNDLDNEKINPETLIWYPGLSNWTKAKDLPELQDIFNLSPPPLRLQNNIPQRITPPTVSGQPIVITPASDKSIFTGKNFIILFLVLGGIYMVFGGDKNGNDYNGSSEVANGFASNYVGKMEKKIAPFTGHDATYNVESFSYDDGIYTIDLHGYWYEKATIFDTEECQVDYRVKLVVKENSGNVLGQTITDRNDCANNHELVNGLIGLGITALSE